MAYFTKYSMYKGVIIFFQNTLVHVCSFRSYTCLLKVSHLLLWKWLLIMKQLPEVSKLEGSHNYIVWIFKVRNIVGHANMWDLVTMDAHVIIIVEDIDVVVERERERVVQEENSIHYQSCDKWLCGSVYSKHSGSCYMLEIQLKLVWRDYYNNLSKRKPLVQTSFLMTSSRSYPPLAYV